MSALWAYRKYLIPYKKLFIASLLSGVLFGAFSGIGLPLIINKVLAQFFETNGGQACGWAVGWALAIPGVFLLRGIFGLMHTYGMSRCGLGVLYGIRCDVFQKLQQMPCDFFDTHTSGDLIAKLWGDPTLVQGTLMDAAKEIFRQPMQMAMAVGYLVYLTFSAEGDIVLLLLALLAIGPMCIIPAKIIRHKTTTYGRNAQHLSAEAMQVIVQNIEAAPDVRAFNLENAQQNTFSAKLKKYVDCELYLKWLENLQQPTMEFLAGIMVAMVFLYAYWRHVPLSTFSAVGTALYLTIDPAKKIANILTNLARVRGAVERINSILHMAVPPATGLPVEHLVGDIVFHEVSFGYQTGRPVLKHVDLVIPQGTTCAFVGKSGAGKTTLARLLPRFYTLNEGKITVAGQDLASLDLYELRRHIAWVAQKPFLFKDTFFNNILVGNPRASVEEVCAAAKNACADEFILASPEGYHTEIGERGDRLSGGQKQRIAIARAFLKNAPIVVLDEATSALDAVSEAHIQEALKRLAQGRTVIVIAHRLSTIRNADNIAVLNEGRVVGFGTHDALLQGEDPIYRELVKLYENAKH